MNADQEDKVDVKVMPDGPILITGPFTLIDADGTEIEVVGERVKLCRCGRSETKPLCDGGHKRSGWQAAEAFVGETPPADAT